VLQAAVELADDSGLEALTMRKLGRALGVEAMSLYNHVDDKEDLIDGIIDVVVSEFSVPASAADWKDAVRGTAGSVRHVLLRHPWACGLIESQSRGGPARLHYLDSVIGVFRAAGFSIEQAFHANLAIDSYVYGYALQEVSWPFDSETMPEAAGDFAQALPSGEYRHLAEMATMIAQSHRDADGDFAFGLDLILDGLERLRDEG
jgi:AcrR family transcriptional regulator